MTVTKEDFPTTITGPHHHLIEINDRDEKADWLANSAMQSKHAIHSTFAVHKFPVFL